MTEEFRQRKEGLEKLAMEHGIENLRQLSLKAGLKESNLYSNLNGTFGMSIKRMFRLANVIGVDIKEVIEVLYPEEYAENQKVPCAR